jgi:hypothetical protein
MYARKNELWGQLRGPIKGTPYLIISDRAKGVIFHIGGHDYD